MKYVYFEEIFGGSTKVESEILVATNLLGRSKRQAFLKGRGRILLSWICVTKCVLVCFIRGWMPFFLKGTLFGYKNTLYRYRNSICKMSTPTNSEVTQEKVTRNEEKKKPNPKQKGKKKVPKTL